MAEGGRIEADGLVTIHVQGSVEGVLVCRSGARVWIGGDLRGEVQTGEPIMDLHVLGDLTGSVRPIARGALLYVDVRGRADSRVLTPIASYKYVDLFVAAAASDLGDGIHRLGPGRVPSAFVAVTGKLP